MLDTDLGGALDVRGWPYPKSNESATAAPTVTDDIGSGYEVGSIWVDTTHNAVYQCVSNARGAAVWVAGGGTGGAMSAGTMWLYKAKTSATSGYPGDGYLLWNNATQTSATSLIFAHLTTDNLDIDIVLGTLAAGQTLILQDSNNSDNYQKWTVSSGPTNTNGGTATSYWTVPVTLVASAGTGTTGFANNHQLVVFAIRNLSGNVGPAGPPGMDGIDGEDGPPGAPGPAGTMGPTGPAGASGIGIVLDGIDGEDGQPGPPGQSGAGVPTGGTANQVLAKVDGTNYNTYWSSVTSITTDQVVNQMRNSQFFTNTNWSAGTGTTATYGQTCATALQTVGLPRVYAVKLNRSAAGDGYLGSTGGNRPKVIPGDVVTLSAWIDASGVSGGNVGLRVICFTSGGGVAADLESTTITPGTGPTLFSTNFTMPATTDYIEVRLQHRGTGDCLYSGLMCSLNSGPYAYKPNPLDLNGNWA